MAYFGIFKFLLSLVRLYRFPIRRARIWQSQDGEVARRDHSSLPHAKPDRGRCQP